MRFLIAILCGIPALLRADLPISADNEDLRRTAQVVSVSEGQTRQLYLHDGKEFLVVWQDDQDPVHRSETCTSGDLIEFVHLSSRWTELIPRTAARSIRVVGRAKPAIQKAINARQINDADVLHLSVSIRGTIASVVRDNLDSQWNWIVLKTPTGKVLATVTENEYPLAKLRTLIDSEADCIGIVTDFQRWRSYLGRYLTLYGEGGISITRPVDTTPFDTALSIEESDGLHRCRTSGIVTGTGGKNVFIVDARGSFLPLVLSDEASLPRIGSTVTAIGFKEFGTCGLQLVEVQLREETVPLQPKPTAQNVSEGQLFTDVSGHDIASFTYFGKAIRIVGDVTSTFDDIQSTGHFTVQLGHHQVAVDATALRGTLPSDFGYGYSVSLAGMCTAEFDNVPSAALPTFKGFTIYPRDSADLTIIGRPSWWSPIRLLILIGVLVISISAVLVWNRALHTLSERRGRELASEQLQHATAELKIEERTHLAVELHDSISQTMTGIALQMEAASDALGTSAGPARKFLDTAQQMIASCRQELRGCLWDLRSRTFEEKDMTEAILRTVAPHVGTIAVSVRFNVPREDLSESSAHTILRTIRELVVNAIRHGKATHIRIAGERNGNEIRFFVRDNGCGFDTASAPGPIEGHFGLQGIRERVAEANGSLTIKTAPKHGTKITVTLTEKSS